MSTTTDSITTVQPVTVTPEVTTRFTGQTDEAFPFNSEVSTYAVPMGPVICLLFQMMDKVCGFEKVPISLSPAYKAQTSNWFELELLAHWHQLMGINSYGL